MKTLALVIVTAGALMGSCLIAAPPPQHAVPTQVDVPALQQDVFTHQIGSDFITFGAPITVDWPAVTQTTGVAVPVATQGFSPVNRNWLAVRAVPTVSKDDAAGFGSFTATYRAPEEARYGVMKGVAIEYPLDCSGGASLGVTDAADALTKV